MNQSIHQSIDQPIDRSTAIINIVHCCSYHYHVCLFVRRLVVAGFFFLSFFQMNERIDQLRLARALCTLRYCAWSKSRKRSSWIKDNKASCRDFLSSIGCWLEWEGEGVPDDGADDDDDAGGGGLAAAGWYWCSCCWGCCCCAATDDDGPPPPPLFPPMFRAAKSDAVAALRSMGAAAGAGGGALFRELSTATNKLFVSSLSLSLGNQIPRIVAGPMLSLSFLLSLSPSFLFS
mmetsp:Transcript_29861/g.63935  ORF Transcript_29861/g.63935 Transcript_29861/m.63935 type:complete len:233 (+) Transcript_29861:306-1004(+)